LFLWKRKPLEFKMKKVIVLIVLMCAFNKSNAQILTFLKSTEFQLIKSQVMKVSFNNIESPFVGDIEKVEPVNDLISDPNIEYVYSDESGDIIRSIYLDKDYIVFSYHLDAGSNTGTLIYNRASQKQTTFNFHTVKLKGRNLSVVREGYKNGHWWQSGNLNLTNQEIVWSKNIDR
jgi:hypothetical protein